MAAPDIDTLARRLRPLISRLSYVVRHVGPKQELTQTQSSILATLRSRGSMRMGELAELEGVAMPSMTDGVRRLEQLGYVRRVPGTQDRRVVNVDITDLGVNLLTSYINARDGFYADRLARLSRSERKAIASAIEPLYKLLQDDASEEI